MKNLRKWILFEKFLYWPGTWKLFRRALKVLEENPLKKLFFIFWKRSLKIFHENQSFWCFPRDFEWQDWLKVKSLKKGLIWKWRYTTVLLISNLQRNWKIILKASTDDIAIDFNSYNWKFICGKFRYWKSDFTNWYSIISSCSRMFYSMEWNEAVDNSHEVLLLLSVWDVWIQKFTRPWDENMKFITITKTHSLEVPAIYLRD